MYFFFRPNSELGVELLGSTGSFRMGFVLFRTIALCSLPANRDYAVVFATLYILSLVGLVVNLLSDLTYTWVDPRIDFETREV